MTRKKSILVQNFQNGQQIILMPNSKELKEVYVKHKPVIIVKGDTLNYKTKDFAKVGDRTIGDILKKLPGVEVSEGGKITYRNKPITSLNIDGDDLLDDKYNIATKTIPHQSVDKIQVIEKNQPIKMLRNNHFSEDIALNLVLTNKARLKLIGEAQIGLGGLNQKFDAGVTSMLFQKKIKFLNFLKANNIGTNLANDIVAQNGFFSRENIISQQEINHPNISQNRFLINRNALLTINHLINFKNDWSLKSNINTLTDKQFQNHQSLSHIITNTETINVQQKSTQILKPQLIQANLNLKANKSAYYLNQNIKIEYNNINSEGSNLLNNDNFNQSLKNPIHIFSYEGSFLKLLKNKHIIKSNINIDLEDRNENLLVSPGVFKEKLNFGKDYKNLLQQIGNQRKKATLSWGYVINHQKFKQEYSISTHFENQKIYSQLFVQNKSTNSLASLNQLNSSTWNVKSSNKWSWVDENWLVDISLPIHLNKVLINDEAQFFKNQFQKILITPNIHINFPSIANHFIELRYQFNNFTNPINQLYRGFILSSYRTLQSYQNSLMLQNVHHLMLNIDFKKPEKFWFINSQLTLSKNYSPFIEINNFTNSIQQNSTLLIPNHSYQIGVSHAWSTYIPAIKTNFNAKYQWNLRKYNTLINKDLNKITQKTNQFELFFDTNISKKISLNTRSNYITSTFGNNFQNTIQQKSLLFRPQLLIKWNERWLQKISFEYRQNQSNFNNPTHFKSIDANLDYKFKKSNSELNLIVLNLLNQKIYENNYIYKNISYFNSYQLIGGVYMLKYIFNF